MHHLIVGCLCIELTAVFNCAHILYICIRDWSTAKQYLLSKFKGVVSKLEKQESVKDQVTHKGVISKLERQEPGKNQVIHKDVEFKFERQDPSKDQAIHKGVVSKLERQEPGKE
jgi:hypothetical protein